MLRIDGNKKLLYKNEAVNILLKKAGLSEKDLYTILPKNINNLINASLKKKQPYYMLEVGIENRFYFYNLIPVHEYNYVNLYGRNGTELKKTEFELKRSKKEIEGWNIELEKRVLEKSKELEKTHERLLRAEKLSAMGRLSAGLAHELNSPLAGLLPMLQKYRRTAEPDSDNYGDLTLMLRACEYMSKIVRHFSVFVKKPLKDFTELRQNNIIESTLSFSSGLLEKNVIK